MVCVCGMCYVNLTAVYCVAIIAALLIVFGLFYFDPITWPKVLIAAVGELCVETFVRHAEKATIGKSLGVDI